MKIFIIKWYKIIIFDEWIGIVIVVQGRMSVVCLVG